MGIKTEDFVKGLPPREITEGVEWIEILDSFDPTLLEDRFINECARRNSYETCYRWEKDGRVPEPIEERLEFSDFCVQLRRQELENCIKRIPEEGLTPTIYKNAREALIRAIGQIGALEYNRREYRRLGEDGRRQQAEKYAQWEQERDKPKKLEDGGLRQRRRVGPVYV